MSCSIRLCSERLKEHTITIIYDMLSGSKPPRQAPHPTELLLKNVSEFSFVKFLIVNIF